MTVLEAMRSMNIPGYDEYFLPAPAMPIRAFAGVFNEEIHL